VSIRRGYTTLAVVALVASIALATAHVALGVFSKLVVGGPLTVASSTLSPATAVNLTQVNCRLKKTPEIEVDWAATSSSYVTSYIVERATSSAGPYSERTTIPTEQTVYTDKGGSLTYSTTYYYRVSAVYRSWSTVSTVKSIRTLSNLCV
jgi:hypothetical protein